VQEEQRMARRMRPQVFALTFVPAIGFYERMGATLLPDWRIARVTGKDLQEFGRSDLY